MKNFTLSLFAFTCALVLCHAEPPVSKRPLVFHNWPPKSAKQLNANRQANKQKTFVVQIRSDQPVPLVLKGARGGQAAQAHHGHLHHGHAHAHALHAPPHGHHLHHFHQAAAHGMRGLGGPRPLKLAAAPVYLKTTPNYPKPTAVRKPLKIKLTSSKPKGKPSFNYDKPFKYEKPHTLDYATFIGDGHQSSLDTTHTNFISDHFAPIHTIPAPNLALHDNHIHIEDTYLPPANSSPQPKPQPYHQYTATGSPSTQNRNQYKVVEDNTNDLTIHDPLSGAQKLFAPDPDPSLPTSKIRPATESFNRPSNGKPLPADVQNNANTNNHNNFVHPAQPLVQIVAEQSPQQQQQQHLVAAIPEIYPIQYAQQTQLQPFVTTNIQTAAPAVASIPLYNPTFLVTQSNNLYSQHKQQLFRPVENVIEAGYVNGDLTQEVASNGQILQAAKDPHHNIHPVLDSAPQFAALIAAPVLGEEHSFEPSAPQGGFVVSNYFSNPQDSSQLLQAYAEEEAQHQQLEELQQAQLHQEHQHLLAQQQQQQEQQEELHQLQQQQYHHQQHQQQQEQQQLHHQQQQQQQQLQQHHQHLQQQQRHQTDPAASAFEEHQRLVQQQLGSNTPLRIFVPDEEIGQDGQRIQKRSDNFIKGIVEDDETAATANTDDMFEVTSSVEVSSEKESTHSD